MRRISPLKIIGVIHFLGLYLVIPFLNEIAHWVNRTNGIFDFLLRPLSYFILIPYIFFGILIFKFDSFVRKQNDKKSYWSSQIIFSLIYLLPILNFSYPKVYPIIKQKIKDRQTKSVGLKEFPQIIQNKSSLEKLDISNNTIADLPKNSDAFTILKTLNISSIKIQQLLKELSFIDLNNHTSLNVSNNNNRDLDSTLLNLQSIYTLNLEGMQIDSIPNCITLLPNLVHLNISNNPVTYISPAIMNLTNLGQILARNTLLTAKQKKELEMYLRLNNYNCYFEW